MGLTTVPETPEPTRSDSHAWSAHPNYGLLATVLGVRPAEPGFKKVRIAPHLGPLQRAEGRVPHPLGEIVLRLARTAGGGLRGEITLPQGSRARWSGAGRKPPCDRADRSCRNESRLVGRPHDWASPLSRPGLGRSVCRIRWSRRARSDASRCLRIRRGRDQLWPRARRAGRWPGHVQGHPVRRLRLGSQPLQSRATAAVLDPVHGMPCSLAPPRCSRTAIGRTSRRPTRTASS